MKLTMCVRDGGVDMVWIWCVVGLRRAGYNNRLLVAMVVPHVVMAGAAYHVHTRYRMPASKLDLLASQLRD